MERIWVAFVYSERGCSRRWWRLRLGSVVVCEGGGRLGEGKEGEEEGCGVGVL